MSKRNNERLAAVAMLLYPVVGVVPLLARDAPGAAELAATISSFCAFFIGVSLWTLTRDVDRDIAVMAMGCRLIEAAPGHGEIYFAVGSTLFAWLLLRGQLVPLPLARLGLVSSAALVLLIVVQLAGFFGGPRNWSSPVTWVLWLPTLIFELWLGVWLLARGTRPIQKAER